MQAESPVDTISSTDDCQKMFRSATALRIAGPTPSLAVHSSQGLFVATHQGKADAIQEWFKEQSTDQKDEPLHPFTGDHRPIQSPIIEADNKALRALNNGRAAEPDGINVKLLKYASDVISKPITRIINSVFETNQSKLWDRVYSSHFPNQKNPPVPPSNPRPIVLLNSIQKILTNVTLCRIQKKTDKFTGDCQSGFERGRSCADIVWAQRMLVSVVMSKHWDFHKKGIDMSRAFDTIKRSKILDVLHQAGCNNDELRLVRLLSWVIFQDSVLKTGLLV